ncbi:LAME_0G09384g1_1 [Lachancea meyersii CBS 8951]|uniref:GTP:AMP phosphotransferase, mitochondrial n=1 Tax=Lachancea meyersii CBS 8951 TaxID=1266667 RepID=A0A1G4K8N9_9SACH|nr:LAME_0G09384g1_1 [Lachancea meyersii CBS 8951]
MNPIRLLLLGAPGSGKGTQTSRLLAHFKHIQSVSSGDLLRLQIQRKTELGKIAAQYISKGALLPDAFVTELVHNELSSRGWLSPSSSFLLDGFPRTLKQAKTLRSKLAPHKAALTMVFELDVPESVILERIENRYVHVPSGRVYNLTYNPPKVAGKDDVTGEPLTKRPDDTVEVFGRRLDNYRETSAPLKEFYAKLGILHRVSGETSDIIFPKLLSLVENSLNGSGTPETSEKSTTRDA